MEALVGLSNRITIRKNSVDAV